MEKKDTTFIFHGAWLDYIEGLNEEQRLKVIWDIVNYGADKDLIYSKEDKFIETIVNFVKGNIDSSKKNYEATIERNQRGGRKKTVDEHKVYELARLGKKSQEIAEELGCSKSTIDNNPGWKNRKNDNYFNEEIKEKSNEKFEF